MLNLFCLILLHSHCNTRKWLTGPLLYDTKSWIRLSLIHHHIFPGPLYQRIIWPNNWMSFSLYKSFVTLKVLLSVLSQFYAPDNAVLPMTNSELLLCVGSVCACMCVWASCGNFSCCGSYVLSYKGEKIQIKQFLTSNELLQEFSILQTVLEAPATCLAF